MSKYADEAEVNIASSRNWGPTTTAPTTNPTPGEPFAAESDPTKETHA